MGTGYYERVTIFLVWAVVTLSHISVNGSPQRFGRDSRPFDLSTNDIGASTPSVLVAPYGFVLPVLNARRLMCRANNMIDQYTLMHAQVCMQRLILQNQESLFSGNSSVLSGDIKQVIKSQCDLFRQLFSCASRVFTFLSECIGNGEEFLAMVTAQVKYVCEADYRNIDEDKLGEGIQQGLACLLSQKESLKACIVSKSNGEAKLSDNMQFELTQLSMRGIGKIQFGSGGRTKNAKICSSLGVIDECVSGQILNRCELPDPEYALTSMYLKVGQALRCDVSRFSRNKRQ